MKNILNNRLFIVLLSFALGAGSLFLYQQYISPKHKLESNFTNKNIDPLFDQFYNDDLFNKSFDPFESMRQMRDKMEKQFQTPNEGRGIFDSWFQKRFGGGSAEEITQREDDQFVYYELKVMGLDQEKVRVSVSDGQLSISGKVEKKTEADGSANYFSSSFHRSFPVPAGVDSTKVQMEQEKDKIIIKFPKLK
ncbi:MAG: Hsp20/alpha crystallin family protein [Bdellovibrionota bacterium]